VRPIRVVLIEDNDVFREALELLFGLQPDLEVVASAADGVEAVELCQRASPEVLVLDYRLPFVDGVQVTAAVRAACPEVAVVCVTAAVNEHEEAALLDAGAVACVRKDGSLDDIVAAIRKAVGRAGG
jgi:DNA-binding NarL/FixJ family response regulator